MSVIEHNVSFTDKNIVGDLIDFPYELDQFQINAIEGIRSGNHVLVTAHTGAGKTTVAEYAVAHGIASGKRVFYTSPIKALSNQIYGDFKKKYPSWNIGIRTGDIDFCSDAQVVIMTTEILQNMLYGNGGHKEMGVDVDIDIANVSVVIFDEVHYIRDRERGSVWERSIIMLPPEIQMIMLSATLPDAREFAGWIAQVKSKDVTWTGTDRRPVPLTHSIMTDKGPVAIMDNDYNFDIDNYKRAWHNYTFEPKDLNSYLERDLIPLPALFFTFSKRACERYARSVNALTDRRQEISKQITYLLRKFDNHEELLTLPQVTEIITMLERGVGYHHAGLIPPLKEIVQELFSAGMLKVLFVTETFAAGVNMPAKSAVFTGFTKYDEVESFRILLPEEYGQMAGRAGRRGKDTIGNVIHLPFDRERHPAMHDIKHMMTGGISKIQPRSDLSYHHVLSMIAGHKAIISSDSLLSRSNAVRATNCERRISELDTEYEKAVADMSEFEQSFIDRMKSYLDFHNSPFPPCNAVKKAYNASGTDKWYKDNKEKCRKYIALNKTLDDLAAKQKGLIEEIDGLRNGQEADLCNIIEFLTVCGFIESPMGNETTYTYTLTLKGIIASNINEADPLALTYIITNDLLDDLDIYQVVAILAGFLPAKEMQRESVLPKKVYDRCVAVRKRIESMGYDDNFQMEYCDIAYLWCLYGNVNRVFAETETTIDIGEFVRMMLKLNNICKETKSACSLCHKDILATALDGVQNLLIRGITIPQSLYVTARSN